MVLHVRLMHTSYIHVLAFFISIIDIHRFDFPRLVRGMGREGPKILEMFKFFTKFSWRDAEKVGLALGCPTRPTGTCPGQNVQFIAICRVWVPDKFKCVSVPIYTGNMIYFFAFLAVNWCVHSFLVINKIDVWDSLTYTSHGIRIFFVGFQKFVSGSFHHPFAAISGARRANDRNSSSNASGSTGGPSSDGRDGGKVRCWDECKVIFPNPLAIMSFMRLYSSGPIGGLILRLTDLFLHVSLDKVDRMMAGFGTTKLLLEWICPAG